MYFYNFSPVGNFKCDQEGGFVSKDDRPGPKRAHRAGADRWRHHQASVDFFCVHF